jgi:hypothetical protein
MAEKIGIKDSFYVEVYRQGRLAHRETHFFEPLLAPRVERVEGDGHSITNRGRDYTAKVLFGGSTPQGPGLRYIGWGTSRALFGSAQTNLQGLTVGSGLAKALASYTHTTGLGSSSIFRTFRVTRTSAIRECAVFGSVTANAGTMIARQVLSTVQNLASADSIRGVWTFSH